MNHILSKSSSDVSSINTDNASKQSSVKSSKSKKSTKSTRSKTSSKSSKSRKKKDPPVVVPPSPPASTSSAILPPASTSNALLPPPVIGKSGTSSSLTARANEYMKRNKEKRLQRSISTDVDTSEDTGNESLVVPLSSPPSPIPTAMRVVSTPSVLTLTPKSKEKLAVPILTPSIFSEEKKSTSLPFFPKSVVTSGRDAIALVSPSDKTAESETPYVQSSSPITSFYTPSTTSFYTPSSLCLDTIAMDTATASTPICSNSMDSPLNTEGENVSSCSLDEEREAVVISPESSPFTNEDSSFSNKYFSNNNTNDDIPVSRSFSSIEDQEELGTSNNVASFLDDFENEDVDTEGAFDNSVIQFDINSPDDGDEVASDDDQTQKIKISDDHREEAQGIADVSPSNEQSTSPNKRKSKTLLRSSDLVMSMEKSTTEEGVEIYDTEYYIRSIVYAVQSAEDAEKTRKEVCIEWVTGSNCTNAEEEEGDADSINTQARMEMINAIACKAISSLLQSTSNLSPPPPSAIAYQTAVPTFQDDLSQIPTPQILLHLQSKMRTTSRAVADLLNAILQGGKWSRRKNACGALKFLSWKNPYGMAYTHGVLTTIACVFNASDSLPSRSITKEEDADEVQAYLEARSRTVTALEHLCRYKKNRILIVNTPALIPSMLKVILHGHGHCGLSDSQQGVCECLALLAKTKENRISMLRVRNLVAGLTSIISIQPSSNSKTANGGFGGMHEDCNDTVQTTDSTEEEEEEEHHSSSSAAFSTSTDGTSIDPNEDSNTLEEDDTSTLQSNHHKQDQSFLENEEDDEQSQTASSQDADDESSGLSSSDSTTHSSKEDDTIFSENDAAREGDCEEIELIVDLNTSAAAGDNHRRNGKYKKKTGLFLDETHKYDDHGNHFLTGARIHSFAALLHLANNKTNAYALCRDTSLITSLLEVSSIFSSPSHTKSIMILSYLTRLHYNNHQMVFRSFSKVVPTFVKACHASNDPICRLYACYAIQNLSVDRTCRQELAIVSGLLSALKSCCMNGGEETLAAISALRNLCDEHANIIQISNTLDCIPTIINLSQAKHSSPIVSFIASDCLAYLSRSLTSISDNGMMYCVEQCKTSMINSPTFQTTHWGQWE